MRKFDTYTETDSMGRLVCENYRVLLVMSRFGLGLGFGSKSIGEVCREQGVDTATFLTVVNMLLNEDSGSYSVSDISVDSLVNYLHQSHDYFLDFRLPAIRAKLVETVGQEDKLSKAIINYFDGYVEEVQKHMQYEETRVFSYVRKLTTGQDTEGYTIKVFGKQHSQVEARLTEFKNILIRFYPSHSSNEINSVLFDIFNCEHDLASHNAIEDHLFIPAIEALEAKKGLRT